VPKERDFITALNHAEIRQYFINRLQVDWRPKAVHQDSVMASKKRRSTDEPDPSPCEVLLSKNTRSRLRDMQSHSDVIHMDGHVRRNGKVSYQRRLFVDWQY
jgi:hypothetical protein